MSGSCPVSAHVCQETARERDELRAEVEALLEDKSQHFHVTRKIPGATVTEYNDPLVRTSRLRALLNPAEGDRDE